MSRKVEKIVGEGKYAIDDDNRSKVEDFLDACQSIIQTSQNSATVRKYRKLLNRYYWLLRDAPFDENGETVWPSHLWNQRESDCIAKYSGKRTISECPYCGRLGLLHFYDNDFDCFVCGREYIDTGYDDYCPWH
jgi:hypothetical protein